MDLMPSLAITISFLRLYLVCSGIWMLVKCLGRSSVFKDSFHKDKSNELFYMSGLVYLLGLLPHSVIVPLGIFDVRLEEDGLCSTQKLLVALSVILHTLLLLDWIFETIKRHHDLTEKSVRNALKKGLTYALFAIILFGIVIRCMFLWNEEEKTTLSYTDIISSNATASGHQGLLASVGQSTQVVRIQLMLCGDSLLPAKKWTYLTISALAAIPIALLSMLLKMIIVQSNFISQTVSESLQIKEGMRVSWWTQNAHRLLSAAVTIWFQFLQPIIFSFFSENFVDFGLHLLLTISAFLPWLISDQSRATREYWI